jgi:hypothetical protein
MLLSDLFDLLSVVPAKRTLWELDLAKAAGFSPWTYSLSGSSVTTIRQLFTTNIPQNAGQKNNSPLLI